MGQGMTIGHLVRTHGVLVVALSVAGTWGCGGRYALGSDDAGGGGTGGTGEAGAADGGTGATTGGTGATTGGAGGTAGTEMTTGGSSGTAGVVVAAGGSAGEPGTGGSSAFGNGGGGFAGKPATVSKVNLLFMVDNSIGMADKQELLEKAIPMLVSRFTHPDCVDEFGSPTGATSDNDGNCPAGVTEFRPVKDLHVGVISSSLGDHGSNNVCSEQTATDQSHYDDGARLMPSVRPGLSSYDDLGFLAWDPDGRYAPAGLDDPSALSVDFQDHVLAAGEHGCGYEGSLEAWYRFLVDPDPVESMSNDGALSVRGPVSGTVLAQRAAFLRADSALAIVMLSDENDCSIVDENETQGWLTSFKGGPAANNWRMPHGTSACAQPNNPCCAPCGSGPKLGCPSPDEDPACADSPLPVSEDSPNLRCFHQRQRFGVDFLYPIGRYIEALTASTIDPRLDGNRVPNPIFAAAPDQDSRDPRSVVLLGIVGVPWQDIATPESLGGDGLAYLTPEQLDAQGRWNVVLGGPGSDPLDPLMIESVDPRPSGAPHPLDPNAAVVGPSDGGWNTINGHEQAPDRFRTDLQLACIFPLSEPRDCDMSNEGGCDCNADEYEKNSPLCDYPTPNQDGTQVYAKAYPSVRELEVLRGLASTGLTASICPKYAVAGEVGPLDERYGYNPAMSSLVNRLRPSLSE